MFYMLFQLPPHVALESFDLLIQLDLLLKVHDEREMDRVLGVNGVQSLASITAILVCFFTLIQFLVTPDKSFSYFITWKLVDSYQSIKPLVYVPQMSPYDEDFIAW